MTGKAGELGMTGKGGGENRTGDEERMTGEEGGENGDGERTTGDGERTTGEGGGENGDGERTTTGGVECNWGGRGRRYDRVQAHSRLNSSVRCNKKNLLSLFSGHLLGGFLPVIAHFFGNIFLV